MKKEIFAFGIMFLLVLALGCTGFGEQQSLNETKLENNQGMGIVGSLKIDELNPGLNGYISLTVRNNLGGENSRDVYVGIDNVRPFDIIECGDAQEPNTLRKSLPTCTGQYNLDSQLPFRIHGTSKMFPGEETEFYWRIKAPSADDISNIALEHPIYYDFEYTYKTSLTQNIIFMSQQEVIKRRQSGEEYLVSGEAKNSAGELRISGSTQQPIIYFFSTEVGDNEQDFAFALQYHVENIGEGIPLSDVVMLFEVPSTSQNGISMDETTMKAYGWEKWNDWKGRVEFRTSKDIPPYSSCTGGNKVYECYCRTGQTNVDDPSKIKLDDCKDWVAYTYGGDEEFSDRFDDVIAEGRLYAKVIKREDFIDSFDIYVPLKINGQHLKTLKDNNIPLQLSTFKVHAMYRYFMEGKDYITVYPIRI